MARGQQTEKKKKPIKYFDYSLLFLIIFLLCFGLVMLYSTSSYAGSNKFGDASYFVKKQLFATGLGIVGMYIVSKIPYRFWMKVSSMAYLAAIVLCTAVIFIGTEANGQARWLKIGPLSFQPSEFAKFAVIIFLATVIYKTPQKMGEFMSLVKIMAIVLPIVAVVAYNNLSTAIIILGIAVCMLFVASPKYSHFVLMAAAVGVVGVVFISRNNKITHTAPKSPSSSQITEKIISFCASGINPSFCILSPSPFPNKPPEPIAYSPCKV